MRISDLNNQVIIEDEKVVQFKPKQAGTKAEPATDDDSTADVIAFKPRAKAAPKKHEEPNPDPNHWWDWRRFDRDLGKVSMNTPNPYWYRLKAETMQKTLTNNPGHPQTLELIWSGELPFEIVKLIMSCMKRAPNGTRDGRPGKTYKPITTKVRQATGDVSDDQI